MGKRLKQAGFTLIELTIVVAIIGILAAIAIPDFLKFQAKARQSEAKVMVGAIATRVMQHKLQTGAYLACPNNPSELPPRQGGKWNDQASEWAKIGFTISGPVHYQYRVEADEKGFVIYATGNIDKDRTNDVWEMSSEDLKLFNTTNDVGN